MPKARPKMSKLSEEEISRRVILEGQDLDKEPGGRLGWLVGFARQDPAKWLPERLALNGYRLLACGLPPLPPNIVSLGGGRSRVAPLTPTEVVLLHRELRNWFHALVTVPGGLPGVKVPTHRYTMRLVRATRPGVKPAIFATGQGGPFRTMLFQRAAAWIVATDRLIKCPTCRQPFLALRKRLFCSAPCLQEHHDEKKIAARRERKRGGRT